MYTYICLQCAQKMHPFAQGGSEKFFMHLWAKPHRGHVNLALEGIKWIAIDIKVQTCEKQIQKRGWQFKLLHTEPSIQTRARVTPTSKKSVCSCSSCNLFSACSDIREDTLALSPFKFLAIQLNYQHNLSCYTGSFYLSHSLEKRPKLISCKSSNSYLIRAMTGHYPLRLHFQLLGKLLYHHEYFVQSCLQRLIISLFSGFS